MSSAIPLPEGSLSSFPAATHFWAKTIVNNLGEMRPGLSVRDHCLNVGFVAEALLGQLPEIIRPMIQPGLATLAAAHDVGKISSGFQVKCPAWIAEHGLTEKALRERWAERLHAESDHAKISQFVLHQLMKPTGTHLWSVAAGVHHGRIFGRRIAQIARIPECEEWEAPARQALLAELVDVFGPLPANPPQDKDVDLWCVAGLISVADWIGSNEDFFPSEGGLSLKQSRHGATRALRLVQWSGGKVKSAQFAELFEGKTPNPLQTTLHGECHAPGLFVVEGPMGSGKTEAALFAAHRLIAAGANDGIYFALPTQVTSNRIHQRVAPFLRSALKESTTLRLAHGASWLEDCQTIRLHPAAAHDPEAAEHVREGRSWFASAKHSLLARYGVGTIDQALQGVVAVKHFFVRRFGLAGKVVVLDEVHSYDVYTGTLITHLIRELLALRCSVIILSATLTRERRRELLAAAGADSGAAKSAAYPLLTVARPDEPLREVPAEAGGSRTLKLRMASLSEPEILEECIARAEAGQHVLYLRNTVAEAQTTCRALTADVRADRVEIGLLHSRFPFFRRQELEDKWLERLGKERSRDGQGSILIATQVVEQSVDIDLDFIVTDLAPTDMLLQRMGRLWRHQRSDRVVDLPEFWINAPVLDRDACARQLKAALGKSGLVYAPYILLRSAEVFGARKAISLPDEIREALEATYADRPIESEPLGWQELRAVLEKDRATQRMQADSATKVFGRQSQQDAEGLLTRRKGAPTRDLILLRGCEIVGRDQWRITPLEGESFLVSGYEWHLQAARVFHRHLVRAPYHTVPPHDAPLWLSLQVHRAAGWALVQNDGALVFPEANDASALAYSAQLGLYVRPDQPQPRYTEDDDEFDC